jgi:hypothetical protein
MKYHFSQRGVAAVEFALLLLPLILIVYGIVEFGLIMYNQQVITNASREGMRAGIVAPNPRLPYNGISCSCANPPCSIECVVIGYAASRLITFGGPGTLSLTYSPTYNVNQPFQTDLTVGVSYDYYYLALAGFVPALQPKLTLNAQTVMKYE